MLSNALLVARRFEWIFAWKEAGFMSTFHLTNPPTPLSEPPDDTVRAVAGTSPLTLADRHRQSMTFFSNWTLREVVLGLATLLFFGMMAFRPQSGQTQHPMLYFVGIVLVCTLAGSSRLGILTALVATANSIFFVATHQEALLEGMMTFLIGGVTVLAIPWSITLLRLQLRQVRSSRNQLLDAHLELQAADEELRAESKALAQFTNLVSHELRTPLTGITLGIQLARRRLGEIERMAASTESRQHMQQVQQVLEIAERQSDLLKRLINDLLDVARIKNDKLALDVKPVDMVAIAAMVIQTQQLAAPDRVLTLHAPTGAEVCCDAERIGQVITNFVSNAIKYTPATSPIEVSITVHRQHIRVAVRDYGHGLTPEQRQRVWEQHYQVRVAGHQNSATPGLGLGLFISKGIIDQHHGRIGVVSQIDQGSTFWFSLPRHVAL